MNSEKRIGINGLFLRKPGTGIGQVTQLFLAELKNLNSEGITYTIYTDTEEIDFPVSGNMKLEYIKPLWKRDDRVRKLLWEHIQLPKRAMAEDVTHFLSLYQAPTELPKNIPHAMAVHDVIPEIFPGYVANTRSRLIWNLTKRAIKKATSIIAVSESTKRDIQKYLEVKEDAIRVAYPSVNPLFFEEQNSESTEKVLQKYSLTPGYLYHGGGLEIRKNAESVLTAYAAWWNSAPHKQEVPKLVISGTVHDASNPLATDVKTLIKKLHVEDSVILLGFVPDADLPALYRGASIFLYPSLYEGFGMPVVEALSQGTAVMSVRNSSLGEVGGEVAFWVEDFTKDTLEQSYKKALQSTDEQKAVRKLQAHAFQSWKNFAQKIINTLIQY